MSIVRLSFSAFLSVAIMCGVAAAQESAPAQAPAGADISTNVGTNASAGVSAAASASGVRFVSTGATRRVRLEVYGAAGARAFDSDFRQGSILDWDGAGVADGRYLCVVTVEDFQGRSARRLSAVSIEAGRVAVLKKGEEELKSEYASALAAAGQTPDASASAASTKKAQAATVTAHDGRDGQLTSTSGALTLRTGDLFSGKEKEQMRVTPEGRVGIGTDNPQATLDVAGTIRAREGIVFPDGTVLTSAGRAPAPSPKNAAAATGPGASALSTTANTLAKFTDGAGTLGNSAITESNGNVGIGTTTPQHPFSVRQNGGTAGVHNIGELFVDRDSRTRSAALVVGTAGTLKWIFGMAAQDDGFQLYDLTNNVGRLYVSPTSGFVGVGTNTPQSRLNVAGDLRVSGAGNGIIFPDGSKMTTAQGGAGSTPSGTSIVSAINDPATAGFINDNRLSPSVARLAAQNAWTGQNTFVNGLSANGVAITNVGNPASATDAANKAYVDSGFVKFVPGAEQLSVGDANGTAPMINLRGGSTCCSGPGGHTPAWFKVFQNGSFVATGNLGIGVSPMQGKGYRTSWDSYKGAFRSGYADAEWDDANVGFFSWAGGSNSTAIGLYALAFGDTNSAESTSSIVFGSGNQVKGAAGFSAGAGNRVCDTYGVAFGNKAQSGGPLINGKCDPDSFNIRGLAAVAIGYNVTADQDHTMAFGKFASNNGFTGTFVWSDGSATASADTFRNTANNEFAARATGGFRFRTNLAGTTGCNLPAGSGVFNCTSSRTTKENFSAVDGGDVLARLRKVPVSTWNYISEGRATRHLSPMAEDFYSAFRLGVGNTSIGVQDAVGVSLAAVKALDARTLELQQKTEEVEQLRAKVNSLEQRLAALEQLVEQNAKRPGAKQQ
ncbi:MAG: hypothetical protein M3348_07330 [Acidobacteriota bacterium]|nr:hypothetical protein [Acidobacteriota bacterium]